METPTDDELLDALVRVGLLAEARPVPAAPLAGGVSSDVLVLDLGDRRVCAKRALAVLKVAARWEAPTDRGRAEADWLEVAGRLVPGRVPDLLGYDAQAGVLFLPYLDPWRHRLWKADLLAGKVDPEVAAAVGAAIGMVHAGTAGRPELAVRFANHTAFDALRLDPYLGATAAVHPDLVGPLDRLRRALGTAGLALVHGDVSPKNVLVGPDGPVLLDAECACWGDPAFDLAFCLNHLLLKCLVVRGAAARLLAAFDALAAAYDERVAWEAPAALEARAAALLPALLLARVDGKSPVEYIHDEATREHVRAAARPLLLDPPARLAEVRDHWHRSLA